MSRLAVFARCALFVSSLAVVNATPAAGLVDPTFGPGGTARVTGANAQGPQALVVKPDGRIVFAARRHDGSGIVVGARKRGGGVDAGFNGGNLLATPALGTAYGPRLADDPAGNTILAYTDFQGGVYRVVLCRILANGMFDPGFSFPSYPGQTGCVRVDAPAGAPNGVIVASVQVMSNGRIAFGGTAYNYSAAAIGKPFEGSATPGSSVGISTIPIANDYVVNAFAADPFSSNVYFGGTIRITGAADTAGFVMKVTNVAATTATFNPNLVPNGIDDVRAFVWRSNGKITAALTAEAPNQTTTCIVYSMNDSDLTPDTSFGPNANGRRDVHFGVSASDATRCDAISTDGGNGLFVVGTASLSSYDAMAAVRLSPVGQIDPGYGAGGASLVNTIGVAPTMYDERGLAAGVQDGRLILGGAAETTVSPTPATSNMLMLRLTDDDHLFEDNFD